MATVRRNPPTRRAPTRAAARRQPREEGSNHIHQRLQWEYVDINDLVPYEWNPRDNSEAVAAVANSIRSFGFLIPVVVDADNVLVAGHTRVEAAKSLGMPEVPAVRATHLTAEQINAFRLIDNKVAEQAKWDFDLLAGEVSKLGGLFDFTQFGWSQEEIDCLGDVVAADCLTATDVVAEAERQAGDVAQRRAPVTARFVLGEVVFFLPVSVYRNWVDGVRQLNDFNESAIATDIKRRLGIVE
jgi:hypothetical protein